MVSKQEWCHPKELILYFKGYTRLLGICDLKYMTAYDYECYGDDPNDPFTLILRPKTKQNE